MKSVTLLSLFTVTFCSEQVVANLPPQDHLNYTVSLIQHLARHQVRTFECIFEDLELNPPLFDDWVGKLLSAPSLHHIIKYVINATFKATYENLPHKPSLVVVNAGNRIFPPPSHPTIVRRNFNYLDSNTRLLVLVNISCIDCVDSITTLLNAGQFDKVVYMDYSRRAIFLMDHMGTITSIFKRFPPPAELFNSTARNLTGRGIRFTSKSVPPIPYTRWVQETARYVNTVAIYLPGICTLSMSLFQCIDELMRTLVLDVAVDKLAVTGLTPGLYRMMFSHEQTSQVVLVPQSRTFNDVEMFVKPFAWESWIVLVVMLLLIEIMSLIFPKLFKNDPILLLVCGFERYNLHEAKTREKLVFFPLIVFFFLMFNAYETKIISFMTNKPTIGRITTLEQLVHSGLKVKANLKYNVRILNDSVLGPLIIPTEPDDSLFRMDGINAYLSDSSQAPDMINSMSNYDFKLHRPKYTELDEKRKSTTGVFYVGLITPLAEIFSFTQRAFFEAGLFDMWQEEVSFHHNLVDRASHMKPDVEDLGLVMFDDLICTWVALAVGLTAATVVFVGEFVSQFRGKF